MTQQIDLGEIEVADFKFLGSKLDSRERNGEINRDPK